MTQNWINTRGLGFWSKYKYKYLPATMLDCVFVNHPVREDRSMYGLNHTYGPFRIGSSEWLLELRLPSYELFLRCLNKSYEGKAKFGFFAFGKRTQYGYLLSQEKGNLEAKKIEFTSAVQEVCIGQLNSVEAKKFSEIHVKFGAKIDIDYYADGSPSDVCFVVHAKDDANKVLAEFAAHRSVLRKGSPVFEVMFREGSEYKEAIEGVVKIGNFYPVTVVFLLTYIYTGEIEGLFESAQTLFDYTMMMELVDAAEQYQIDGFKNACGNRLLEQITCENALELLSASERYRLDGLKRGAMEFIQKNRKEIIGSGNNDDALKQMSQELTIELFKMLA